MPRLSRWILLMMLGIGTVTCARVTINVYFPAAQLRNAAEKIESEVRQGTTPPAPPTETPAPGKPQKQNSWGAPQWHVHFTAGVPEAAAAEIDINITTPTIRRLIASRKRRYPQLVPLFEQGILGEDNRGLVAIRKLAGLPLRQRARVKALVAAENADRQQLYRELAQANHIPVERVGEIAAIFAEVNRQQAQSGWWIQEADGQWRTK